MRRAARATAFLVALVLAVPTAGLSGTASAAPRYTCAGPGTPVPGLAELSLSPDTVHPSARTVSVRGQLTSDATDVMVFLHDTDSEVARSEAITPVARTWTAAVEVPTEVPRGILGLEVRWREGDRWSVARPCDLMAAGLPYQVFVDPLPPAAPVRVTGAAGNRSATVSWAPGDDGYSPVTSWTVTAEPGGHVRRLEGEARSVTVDQLRNGTAYTFSVVAANRQGAGDPATSSAVVPRLPSALGVVSGPVRSVRYGTATAVVGRLADHQGGPIADRPVELLGQPAGSTRWLRLATGRTATDGRVRLTAVLQRSAALRLSHPPDDVGAAQAALGGVSVAQRVSAAASRSRVAVGQPVSVRGSLAPARPGAAVALLVRSADRWQAVASGRTSDTGAYALAWRPSAAGTRSLRVVASGVTGLAAGSSPAISVTGHDTVASLAKALLADRRVTATTVHGSGVRDRATARQNHIDLAAGRPARRSAYGNAPGGSTAVDIRVLRALRELARTSSFTLSEIAGGTHARRSAHYRGLALDITVVGGRKVRRGSGYQAAVRACRSWGATAVWSPSHDPYGGHSGHVHCDWARR